MDDKKIILQLQRYIRDDALKTRRYIRIAKDKKSKWGYPVYSVPYFKASPKVEEISPPIEVKTPMISHWGKPSYQSDLKEYDDEGNVTMDREAEMEAHFAEIFKFAKEISEEAAREAEERERLLKEDSGYRIKDFRKNLQEAIRNNGEKV